MYTPSHVANFMLERAERDGRALSPMKMLKLVYIGYGWCLAVLDEKMFEESIYAWDHGPVVRSLYHEFKHYGKGAIEEMSVSYDLESETLSVPRIPADNKNANIILGKVWDIYKHFNAWDLRDKTHEDGTPWSKTYHEKGRNSVIPDDLIAEHFTRKIKQYIANAKGEAAA